MCYGMPVGAGSTVPRYTQQALDLLATLLVLEWKLY